MCWRLRALFGALLLLIWGCSSAPRPHQTVSVPVRKADPVALLHFIAGKMYELKGNYHAAIIELQEAAAIDSISPTIYSTMARNYWYLNKTDNAIKAAQKAIQIDESFTEGYWFLVSLYERKGEMEGVAKNLEQVIALDPKDVDAYFRLADAYMALEQNDAAISTLKKLEKLEFALPRTQIRMAAFYGALGRDKDAKRLYRQGLQKDPSHGLAWLGLGIILESEGKKDEAIDLYEQALEALVFDPRAMDIFLRLARLYDTEQQVLKSDDPDFLLPLAEALVQGDKRDLAICALEKAVRVGRDDPGIWTHVAYIYSVDMDSLDRAVATLEKAVQVLPNDGDLYLALGEAYEQERKWDQAMAAFQKALTLDPENAEYLFGLASFLEQSGRFDESVATFEKLLAIDADHGFALNYLGYMFADKGIRLQEALGLIRRALEVEPDNGAFLDSMGWVHFRLGHYTEAEEYLDKAVQFEQLMGDEENAVIFDHVGDVAEVLGKLDRAREYWSKSLERDATNQRVQEKLERIGGKEPAK